MTELINLIKSLLDGIGSEGVVGIATYLILKDVVYPKYKKRKYQKDGKDRRKNDTNPHSAPGNATECKEHAKGLTQCKERIKSIKEKLKEYDDKNREDHKTMFRKLDNLKNKR